MKLTILLLVVALQPALAQRESVLRPGEPSPIRFGVEVGPGYNVFSQTVAHSPIDNPTSPWRTLADGDGIGWHASLSADFRFAPRWSVALRAGVEAKQFTTSGSGIADCPDDVGESFDTVAMDAELTTSLGYVTSGFSLQFAPSDRILLTAGVVLHERTGSSREEVRAEITTPGPCVFNSTGTKLFTNETVEALEYCDRRWGIEAGIGYRIVLTHRLALVPAARFQLMLDPVSPDGAIMVDDFRAQTLGRLNLQMTDRSLHAVHLGAGLYWTP